jgi:hypothetical protein
VLEVTLEALKVKILEGGARRQLLKFGLEPQS